MPTKCKKMDNLTDDEIRSLFIDKIYEILAKGNFKSKKWTEILDGAVDEAGIYLYRCALNSEAKTQVLGDNSVEILAKALCHEGKGFESWFESMDSEPLEKRNIDFYWETVLNGHERKAWLFESRLVIDSLGLKNKKDVELSGYVKGVNATEKALGNWLIFKNMPDSEVESIKRAIESARGGVP